MFLLNLRLFIPPDRWSLKSIEWTDTEPDFNTLCNSFSILLNFSRWMCSNTDFDHIKSIDESGISAYDLIPSVLYSILLYFNKSSVVRNILKFLWIIPISSEVSTRCFRSVRANLSVSINQYWLAPCFFAAKLVIIESPGPSSRQL